MRRLKQYLKEHHLLRDKLQGLDEEFSMADNDIDDLALQLKKSWTEQSDFESANASVRQDIKELKVQVQQIRDMLQQLVKASEKK